MSRVVELLTAVASRLKPLVGDEMRVQIDGLDLDMVENESFRDQALRVAFAVAKPEMNAIGSLNLAVTFGVFAFAKGDGPPSDEIESADARALNLAIAVVQKINEDDYVGLTKMSSIVIREMRVFASAATNKKDIALVGLECGATLYDVAAEAPSIALGTGMAQIPLTHVSVNGGPLHPPVEEETP